MSWKNKMLSKEEKWKKRVSTCSTRIGNFYISDDKHQNIVNKKVLWTLNIHQSLAILIAGNVKYKNGGWNFWFELWKMFRIKMMVFDSKWAQFINSNGSNDDPFELFPKLETQILTPLFDKWIKISWWKWAFRHNFMAVFIFQLHLLHFVTIYSTTN